MTLKVHLIAGARPNFMKVGPLWHELKDTSWATPLVVHTGQHYSPEMSEAFLRDLRLPPPDFHLGAGSGTHATQTASIMVAYERLCVSERPDWVIVVGDVNSTLACAIVAKKLQLPVAHLEAGLRSGDRTMPEEINRLVTDAIADLFWTPSDDASDNLMREGVPANRIEMVGNIMIDAYEMLAEQIAVADEPSRFGLKPGSFGVVTLHRPGNVDDPATLGRLVHELGRAAEVLPLVFPVHPRTRARIDSTGLRMHGHLVLTEPIGYIRFMSLVRGARLVVTDSGGVQEETTYLGIPCLTVRETTERPVTVSHGSNRLIAQTGVSEAVRETIEQPPARCPPPRFWDGRTASRVAASLRRHAAA